MNWVVSDASVSPVGTWCSATVEPWVSSQFINTVDFQGNRLANVQAWVDQQPPASPTVLVTGLVEEGQPVTFIGSNIWTTEGTSAVTIQWDVDGVPGQHAQYARLDAHE